MVASEEAKNYEGSEECQWVKRSQGEMHGRSRSNLSSKEPARNQKPWRSKRDAAKDQIRKGKQKRHFKRSQVVRELHLHSIVTHPHKNRNGAKMEMKN